jgi:nucleotide-binding universal stress UspA family protein
MFEQILLPLDGSQAAEMVFPYVTEIASRFGSRITLTRVIESNTPDDEREARSYLKDSREKIKTLMKQWQARDESEVRLTVLTGNPAIEILNHAGKTGCNLIAVASRGESKEGQWPLGNVAAKILRASNAPVLLVRKSVGEPEMRQKSIIKKILVPLDGSKWGEAALTWAESLAKMLEAEIVLFRVIQPSKLLPSEAAGFAWAPTREFEATVKNSIVDYLNRIKGPLQKRVPNISLAITEGFPADQIIDYSEANSVDLITMSTHGRSGIGRWVYGSVTDKVLHAGEKPILVVRPKRV